MSSTWEPVAYGDEPNRFVWAWFKPPGALSGVSVQIPPEAFRGARDPHPLSLRNLAHALGVDPRQVVAASVYGVPFEGQQGANPVWDYLITPPGPGFDPTISLFVLPDVAALHPAAAPVASPSAAAPSGSTPLERFSRMEAAWNSSLQIEQQLAGVAKQLTTMVTRINSLNRDLSTEEFRSADQQDKREWQEARRWLRDIATRLARILKDHTIGITSAAGRRTDYETIYKQFVTPRRTCEGLEQTERDFEMYRKSLETLLNNMIAVHGTAVQDGERRAQQVLIRISAKVRNSRAKR